jgi:hypothetical protein
MNSPASLTRKPSRPQSLEAVAYFEGSHGTELKPGLERCQSIFDEQSAKVSHEAVAREKKHEELLDRVCAMLPGAEAKVAEIKERIGNQKPQFLLPVIALVAASLMALAEVVLLAPALVVLAITDPALQVLAAIGLMFAFTLAYHFAWESFTSDRFPRIWAIITRIVAVLVTVFLIFWGVLRGKQVAFAATLSGNPLGRFLSGHPFLAMAFYVFVTLITPLVFATAMHFSLHHLRDWWALKKANADHDHLQNSRVTAQKALDTEREQHQQALKQLAHECTQWKATYRIHHERGSKHLALKEPMALVYLKAAGVAMLAVGLLFWAPPILPICGAVVGGIATFLYFRHKREHPNPEQYYKVQNIQFAHPIRNVTPPQEPPRLEAKAVPSKPQKGLLQ